MMMASEPKKMAALILMGKKPEGEDMPKEEMDPGLLSASEEVMASLEKKDAESFAKALKDFITICGALKEEGEYSEEEPKE